MKKEEQANKACTRRVGFCRIVKHFSHFGLFPLLDRIHARPHAGNTSRWAGRVQICTTIRKIPANLMAVFALPTLSKSQR
jgi:hypothetical protein